MTFIHLFKTFIDAVFISALICRNSSWNTTYSLLFDKLAMDCQHASFSAQKHLCDSIGALWNKRNMIFQLLSLRKVTDAYCLVGLTSLFANWFESYQIHSHNGLATLLILSQQLFPALAHSNSKPKAGNFILHRGCEPPMWLNVKIFAFVQTSLENYVLLLYNHDKINLCTLAIDICGVSDLLKLFFGSFDAVKYKCFHTKPEVFRAYQTYFHSNLIFYERTWIF